MTPGPEDEVSQAEKARVIREQASSILDHARAAANDLGGGRFAGVNPTTVVGSEPAVKYPAASSSWQIQLPDEPPLGYRVDDMPGSELPSTELSAVEQLPGSVPDAAASTNDAPLLPPDVAQRDAGSGPSSDGEV
jgi:hypothetical protein